MRKFWTIIALLSIAVSFAVGLICVRANCEGSLEPFILLCIFSALGVPHLIKNLFSKDSEHSTTDNKQGGRRFLKFMLIGVAVASIVIGGLLYLNSKYGGLGSVEIIAIGVSTLILFAIIYFFMWFLPDKI